MVDTHAHLKAIVSPARLGVLRQVNGSVANQVRQGTRRLESLQVGHEVADGSERRQLQLHHSVRVLRKLELLGDGLALPNEREGEG